jgi:hypothetical protein
MIMEDDRVLAAERLSTSEGLSDGVADGATGGVADGPADGVADGLADGVVDGLADGTADGSALFDGAPDGISVVSAAVRVHVGTIDTSCPLPYASAPKRVMSDPSVGAVILKSLLE